MELIETLQGQVETIADDEPIHPAPPAKAPKKRRLSAAARARIAAAARARWARIKGTAPAPSKPSKNGGRRSRTGGSAGIIATTKAERFNKEQATEKTEKGVAVSND